MNIHAAFDTAAARAAQAPTRRRRSAARAEAVDDLLMARRASISGVA
jgi:hypothetical protein